MDFAPDDPLATDEFHATWRSRHGAVVSAFAFIGLVLLVAAAVAHNGLSLLLLAFAFLVLWFVWWVGRPLWDGQPLLSFGPGGVSGRAPGRFTVAWSEVADLRMVMIQGNAQLVITLVPPPGEVQRKRWWGVGAEKRMALTGLSEAMQTQAYEAGYRQFMLRAHPQAEQALHQQVAEIQAHTEFDARLAALTPRVWAMPTVMLACAAVWVANVMSGMSVTSPGSEDLFRWGANSASAVQAGQWWRLVTAMFLHGGILHLALNMFALWESGLMVTRLFGNRGFIVIYLGAGLAGNALSLHFAGQTGVSVGASGAVFGVAGALLAAVIQHGGKFPMGRSRQMLTSLGIFILYSLAYGFSNKGIDNAAHIGGLLAGFAAGWLLAEKIDDNATPARRNLSVAIAAGVCLVLTVGLAFTAAPAKRDMAAYFAAIKQWNELQPALTGAMEGLKADSIRLKDKTLDEEGLQRRLETVHGPALRRVADGFAAVNLPKDELVGRYAEAQGRYAGAMASLIEADVQRLKTPSPEMTQKVERLQVEAKQANDAIAALNAEAAERKKR